MTDHRNKHIPSKPNAQHLPTVLCAQLFTKTIGRGIEKEKIRKREREGKAVRKREGDTHRKGKYEEKEKRKKQGGHFQQQYGFIKCTWC